MVNRNTKELVLWDCETHQNKSLGSISNIGSGTALSPDEKTLAIGTVEGTVILWNIAKHTQQYTLQADPLRPVNSLAFSADGRILAVGSGDPALITLWDVALRKQIGHFQHSNSAKGIAFSPDGKVLAVANWQGYVYLWNFTVNFTPRLEDLPRLKAHTKPITDVVFSSDGKTLATASEDKTIKLWNVATQREMITLRGPDEYPIHLAFSPDGKSLASADDKTVWVWQAAAQLSP